MTRYETNESNQAFVLNATLLRHAAPGVCCLSRNYPLHKETWSPPLNLNTTAWETTITFLPGERENEGTERMVERTENTEWKWKTWIIGKWPWPCAHQGLLESSLFLLGVTLATDSDRDEEEEVMEEKKCVVVRSRWVVSHPHGRLNTSLGHTDTCVQMLSSFMRVIWEVYRDGLIRSACLQLI